MEEKIFPMTEVIVSKSIPERNIWAGTHGYCYGTIGNLYLVDLFDGRGRVFRSNVKLRKEHIKKVSYDG